jgi:4-hydroxybenzoate polyprenyltransferase
MVRRLSIYFTEQARPMFLLLLSLATAVSVSGMYEVSLGRQSIEIGSTLLVVAVTYFLVFMHWRVSDEFKDHETDRRFFPHRPVPSGRVLLGDLRMLLGAITVIILIVNILWGAALVPFLAVFIYMLLMSKWFFMEKYIAPNRFVAVLTHAPIILLLNVYIMASYPPISTRALFDPTTLTIAFWFSLPALTCEFARKAWAPSQEKRGYQTYSSMVGHRAAGSLPVIFIALQWLLLAVLYSHLHLTARLLLLTAIPMVAFTWVCVGYIRRPEEYAKWLNQLAPLYLLAIPAVVSIYLILSQHLRFVV